MSTSSIYSSLISNLVSEVVYLVSKSDSSASSESAKSRPPMCNFESTLENQDFILEPRLRNLLLLLLTASSDDDAVVSGEDKVDELAEDACMEAG